MSNALGSRLVLAVALIACATLLCSGCAPEEPVVPPGISTHVDVGGPVLGGTSHDDSQVRVLWATEQLGWLAQGAGWLDGDRFSLVLEEAPPEAALRGDPEWGRVALGFLVVFPVWANVPEIVCDAGPEIRELVSGMSLRHALLWRTPRDPWAGPLAVRHSFWERFEPGYGCGECVPGEIGDAHETYRPVGCDSVEVQTPPALHDIPPCNQRQVDEVSGWCAGIPATSMIWSPERERGA